MTSLHFTQTVDREIERFCRVAIEVCLNRLAGESCGKIWIYTQLDEHSVSNVSFIETAEEFLWLQEYERQHSVDGNEAEVSALIEGDALPELLSHACGLSPMPRRIIACCDVATGRVELSIDHDPMTDPDDPEDMPNDVRDRWILDHGGKPFHLRNTPGYVPPLVSEPIPAPPALPSNESFDAFREAALKLSLEFWGNDPGCQRIWIYTYAEQDMMSNTAYFETDSNFLNAPRVGELHPGTADDADDFYDWSWFVEDLNGEEAADLYFSLEAEKLLPARIITSCDVNTKQMSVQWETRMEMPERTAGDPLDSYERIRNDWESAKGGKPFIKNLENGHFMPDAIEFDPE